jgi:hypothetical protein
MDDRVPWEAEELGPEWLRIELDAELEPLPPERPPGR